MPLGETYEDDWLIWIEREDITLRTRVSLTPTYTNHTLTYDGGAAKRRAITNKEIYRSNGVYTGKNQVWIIPKMVLPDGVVPKPGHVVVDSEGISHTILEVQKGKWTQTHRCVTIIVNIEEDLDQLCDIERYSNKQDEAGRPTYDEVSEVYAGIQCHVQPMDSRVAMIQGRKLLPNEYYAVLAYPVEVRPHDVLVAYAPGEITATGTEYTITGTSDPKRLDEAFKIFLQKIL